MSGHSRSFSLEDLDMMNEGFGDRICSLLHKADSTSDPLVVTRVREEIRDLLDEKGIEQSEVLITKGAGKGMVLPDALDYIASGVSSRTPSLWWRCWD